MRTFFLYKYYKIILIQSIFFVLIPSSFLYSQDENKLFYQNIEPRIFAGASQWLYEQHLPYVYHHGYSFLINKPINEFGISYSYHLNEDFVIYPYIGYSDLVIYCVEDNSGPNYTSYAYFSSFIAGGSFYYKLNHWNLGVCIYGKKILSVNNWKSSETTKFGTSTTNEDITSEYGSIYYLTGFSIMYSLGHFNFLAESRFNILGDGTFSYNATEHINEYLLGIGYHL